MRVPRDLTAVTTIDADRECDPEDAGLSTTRLARIWSAVTSYYRTGLHPAISLVMRRRGRIVMSRGLGHARGGGPGETGTPATLMTADTPACLFSASKAVTAMLVHKLAEDGRLGLDDRVADHLPGFAANGKADVTIRHLLTHRAGISRIPFDEPDPSLLADWDLIVATLCAAPGDSGAGARQAYHAVTSGFILGEVAIRVTGTPLRDLLRATLADPLGCPHLGFGVAPENRDHFALSYATGPKTFVPITQLLERVLGLPLQLVASVMNTDEALSAIMPSANVFASAEEMSRFFQMLLDEGMWEGRPLFAASTIEAARQPAGPLVIDGTLPAPIRFSAGFMLGEPVFGLFGLNAPRAFGHLGFLNIVCWADPDRDLAAAFLNTGKTVAPEGFLGFANVMRAISQHVPADRVRDRPRGA